MTRVIWNWSTKNGALIFFLWWGKGLWRWPKIERISRNQWRYKIGPFDGKYRHGAPERTQLRRG